MDWSRHSLLLSLSATSMMLEKHHHNVFWGFVMPQKKVYAAVMYLRGKSPASSCTAKFLFFCAKTRVSPIQGHSIPRLELLAALLLVRLISSVSAALEDELKLE